MKKTAYRSAGSYAAFMQTALWLTFVFFIIVINPALGLATPADLSNPAALLPALAAAPGLIIFPGLDLLVGLSLLLVVLRFDTALNETGKPWYATIMGMMAALFFIALSTSRLHTLPLLAQMYAQNPAGAGDQFMLLNALHDGLSAATRLTLGLWLLLNSSELVRQHHDRTFAYLGILTGLLNIGSAFFQPLAGPNMILLPVWFYLAGRWMIVKLR